MTYRIFCFVKFFEKEEWADDFMKGKLYCNTLQYFRDIEVTGDGRGDPFEGAVALLQPHEMVIKFSFNSEKMKDFTINPNDLAGPVVIHSDENLTNNVYCMHAIYVDDNFQEFSDIQLTDEELKIRVASVSKKLELHEDCYGMGQHAVLVYSVEPFMEALKLYEKNNNMRLRRGLVKYYDGTVFNGDFKEHEAIFHKQMQYAHQKEYRIAFRSPAKSAFTLDIGSIENFAKKMTTDEIRQLTLTIAPRENDKQLHD